MSYPHKIVKVFGIERSGTVFIQELFAANFLNGGAISNHFGSKHRPVQDTEAWLKTDEAEEWAKNVYIYHKHTGIGFIIVVKNPYYWLQSIRAWRKRTGEAFDMAGEMRRYNDLYLNFWDKLIEHNHPFFTYGAIQDYHQLITETESLIDIFAEYYGFKKRPEKVIPRKVELSDEFTDERRSFYLKPISLEMDEIAAINDNVSDDFFTKYQYKRWNAV